MTSLPDSPRSRVACFALCLTLATSLAIGREAAAVLPDEGDCPAVSGAAGGGRSDDGAQDAAPLLLKEGTVRPPC